MHKTIWFKIHWFLGITAGIILLIVAVSGAILSFEKEILRAINQKTYYVNIPTGQEKLTVKELLEKFQEKMPESKINGVTHSTSPEDSSVILIAGEGENAKKGINKYINPYTAEILPDIIGRDFFSFNLRLHRWLAFPQEIREIGKQTVAISTISLIILIISAIVIYWGRISRAFFKSFTFNPKHKGRAFLSTIHSAIGMWVIPFYLLVSLTGLMWSYQWFNSMVYAIAGVEKPQRQMQPPQQNGQKIEGQQTKQKHEFPREEKSSAKFDDLQKAVNIFNIFVQKDYYTFTIKFPQKGNMYSFSYLDTKSDYFRSSNILELDIDSSQLLKHERFEDKPLNEKLLKSILPLHTGEYFGLVGQIGMFLSSLLMSLFTITGFMLYFNRKNKKKVKIKEEF